MVVAWFGVGVLMERWSGMGPVLTIEHMGAPVDGIKRHRYAGGKEAWHGLLLEVYQMGAPVHGWGRRRCAGGEEVWHGPLLE